MKSIRLNKIKAHKSISYGYNFQLCVWSLRCDIQFKQLEAEYGLILTQI
jgi:hypothetical protein